MATINRIRWSNSAALAWLFGPRLAGGPWPRHRAGHAQRRARRLWAKWRWSSRVQDSLAGLNPGLPPSALDDAFRKLTRSRRFDS